MSDFTDLPDLASEQVGGVVLAANDEFFAPKENLIKSSAPICNDVYTDRGKWMDGWETRRRREPGYDWAIVRLGLPGVVRGVIVDTSYFRGNYPEACSIDACELPDSADLEAVMDANAGWRELVPRSQLQGDALNRFAITATERVTHLRLNIYPDGGVARLRVYGEVTPEWDYIDFRGGWVDLAAIEYGGCVLGVSDQFFGSSHQLIMPGRARNMSEGWETRRRRGPGHDWAIVKLGARGIIDRVDVDTSHFMGNAPGQCSIEVCDTDRGMDFLTSDECPWQELLSRTKLEPNKHHLFANELRLTDPATHARLNIYPDGGVARLRLYGSTVRSQDILAAVTELNSQDEGEFLRNMMSCCSSQGWARAMAEARPFADYSTLIRTANCLWRECEKSDWLEAFAAHPRIGQRKQGEDRFAAWSKGEQSGVKGADPRILEELARANDEYYERFGYTFIVFASGKSAKAMLEILRERLDNDPDDEIAVAAEEQRKITRLRLGKLIRDMTETPSEGKEIR